MKDTWKSLRITKNGSILIDPAEVYASPEFKAAREKARKIVMNNED